MSSVNSKSLLSLDLRFDTMDVKGAASRVSLPATEVGFYVRDRLTQAVVYVAQQALIQHVAKYDVTAEEAKEWLSTMPKKLSGYEVTALPKAVSEQYTKLSKTLSLWFRRLDQTAIQTYVVDLLRRKSTVEGIVYPGIIGLHDRTVVKIHNRAIYCLADKKNDKILGKGSYKTVFRSFEALSGKQYAAAFSVFANAAMSLSQIYRYKEVSSIPGCLALRDCVRIFTASGVQNLLFLPHCDRGSLGPLLPHLTSEEKRIFFCRIIQTIANLHKNSWVHGDLKPDNILVDGMNFLLSDFDGLARADSRIPGFIGTSYYFSPERATAALCLNYQFATPAIDMWALGAMLTQVFTKEALPFWAKLSQTKTAQGFNLWIRRTALQPQFLQEPPSNTAAHLVWQMLDVDASSRISAAAAVQALSNLKFDDKTWDYQFRLYAPTPAPAEVSTVPAASPAPSPIEGFARTPLPAASPVAEVEMLRSAPVAFMQGVRMVAFPLSKWEPKAPPPSPAGSEVDTL